jgi:hypothetical protein
MNTVMRFIKDLGVDIISQKMELDCRLIFAIRKKEALKAQEKFTGLKNISIKKVVDE